MKTKTFNIKNMVCPRCVMSVRDIFSDLGYDVKHVELGKVEVMSDADISADELTLRLQEKGFELLIDREDKIHEEIKNALITYLNMIQNEGNPQKLSEWLPYETGHSYSYLSKLFSEKEGITLSNYFIKLKIEKVKELLAYGELTLSEIAWKLGYSSVQHLSNQFKEITGHSVSEYKSAGSNGRRTLDSIT